MYPPLEISQRHHLGVFLRGRPERLGHSLWFSFETLKAAQEAQNSPGTPCNPPEHFLSAALNHSGASFFWAETPLLGTKRYTQNKTRPCGFSFFRGYEGNREPCPTPGFVLHWHVWVCVLRVPCSGLFKGKPTGQQTCWVPDPYSTSAHRKGCLFLRRCAATRTRKTDGCCLGSTFNLLFCRHWIQSNCHVLVLWQRGRVSPCGNCTCSGV